MRKASFDRLHTKCLSQPKLTSFFCPLKLNDNGSARVTHFSLETPKWVIGKQCIPRPDAATLRKQAYSNILKI